MKQQQNKTLCNLNCNYCPLIRRQNSKQLSRIMNKIYDTFGNELLKILNDPEIGCPNLTCCPDCHIDDFCHDEGGCDVYPEAIAKFREANRKYLLPNLDHEPVKSYKVVHSNNTSDEN